jgi:1,4-dihydroxy-2-naphthoyl-CoA hydrolase
MATLWRTDATLEVMRERCRNTLAEYLGIELTELGADYLTGTMRVDHRTCQPMRLLHGGASVALAETLGSLAANAANRDPERHFVGQEINANHLRPVPEGGLVIGTARRFTSAPRARSGALSWSTNRQNASALHASQWPPSRNPRRATG